MAVSLVHDTMVICVVMLMIYKKGSDAFYCEKSVACEG